MANFHHTLRGILSEYILTDFLLGDVLIGVTQQKMHLDWSKLKAFADDKIKALKMMIFVFDRTENIVGKEENAGYQHFLLF